MKLDMKFATNSNANPILNDTQHPSPTTSTTSQPLLYASNLSKSVNVGEQRIDIIKGINVAVQAGEVAVADQPATPDSAVLLVVVPVTV